MIFKDKSRRVDSSLVQTGTTFTPDCYGRNYYFEKQYNTTILHDCCTVPIYFQIRNDQMVMPLSAFLMAIFTNFKTAEL